jgi:Na+/melibiose symporter-like transporter
MFTKMAFDAVKSPHIRRIGKGLFTPSQPAQRQWGASEMPAARSPLLPLFAAGHFSKSLMWSFSDLLFAYFAHVHLGLPAEETGWIIFISLIYSGALDVIAAILLSAFPGQERSVPRLQFVGAILTAIFAILLFWPLSLSSDVLFYWLLGTSLLFRTGYGLYDVTQNALVSLLPRDDAEARRYVTARTTLSYAAKVLVALTSFALIGTGEWRGAALLTMAPIAAMMIAAAGPMSRHPIGEREDLPAPGSPPPIRLLLPTLAAVGAQICLLGLIGRFLPFAQDPQTGAAIGAPLVLASVIGGMFGPLLGDRVIVRRHGFSIVNVGFTGLCIASALAIMFGQTTAQIVAAAAIFSIGGGAVSTLVWNQLSAAVRTHARCSGQRADLASFALLTATIKLGAGGTGLFLGQLLDGYEAGTSSAVIAISVATVAGGLFSIAAMAFGQVRLRRAGHGDLAAA